MEPENVHIGTTVRVRDRHRIAERRGMVGRVTGRYGGDGYVAVDVRFSGGQQRLFRPEDLEEISPPRPWWRSLLNLEGENRNLERARIRTSSRLRTPGSWFIYRVWLRSR